MGETEKYKTGEIPMYADIVQGVPNNSRSSVAGIVAACFEGSLSIIYLKPDSSGDIIRVYGSACNFDLIARNSRGNEWP